MAKFAPENLSVTRTLTMANKMMGKDRGTVPNPSKGGSTKWVAPKPSGGLSKANQGFVRGGAKKA